MVKSEKAPSGYIYRANNIHNGKNYLGKTGKTIEERWSEHLEDGRALKRVREANPDKKIYGTHLDNALAKYGPDAFIVTQEDVAFSEAELNKKERHYVKEYDSMNPDKGYNMTEGGEGGRMRPEVIEKLRQIGKEKANDPEWVKKVSKGVSDKYQNDPEYYEKQAKERRERGKDADWVEKMTKINQEKGKDPKFREKMRKVGSEKWENDLEYQKKQLQERRERGDDPKFREKMRDVNRRYKKEIKDKKEFLEDIQKMQSKEIAKKYDMNRSTLNKRIHEMLGEHGVKNYKEAGNYLEGKNLDKVVKDINERLDKPFQNYEGKPISSNKREFLEDIKNMLKNEINYKYRMGAKSITRKIKEMLGEYGVKNYTEAKKYLNGKNLDEVLKDIEQRSVEKPDDNKISEGTSKKIDEESKEQKEKEIKKSETSEDKPEVGKEKKQEKTEEGQKEKEVKESMEKPAEQQEHEVPNSQEIVQEEAREKLDNKASESSESLTDEHSEELTEDPKKTEDENLPEQEEGELGTLENVSNEQPKSQAEKTLKTKSNASLENSDQNISFKTSGLKPPDSGAKEGDIVIINGVEYVVKEVRPVINRGIFFDTFQGATDGRIGRDIDGIDQNKLEKQNDYNGVEDLPDSGDEDFTGIEEDLPEEGSDFAGIDTPLENCDVDYDKVAKEYSDGGESGGAS